MKISVIFTTYNSPVWLEKVLWGFHYQTDREFEIVVADDGSGPDTRDVIEKFRRETDLEVQHIWQEDDGFQKCRILNKAILAASGEYMIATDGDCIPRNDFVAVHRRYAEPGRFLSGGYVKLPMETSKAITLDDIATGRCFEKQWLIAHGAKTPLKITVSGKLAVLLNHLTMTKPTWNGHNASCFIEDAKYINGYDERLRYGGLDREFGSRLLNAGLKPKQIRYSAVCVHLDHSRGYVTDEDWRNNWSIRKTTMRDKVVQTPAGISQLSS